MAVTVLGLAVGFTKTTLPEVPNYSNNVSYDIVIPVPVLAITGAAITILTLSTL